MLKPKGPKLEKLLKGTHGHKIGGCYDLIHHYSPVAMPDRGFYWRNYTQFY